MSDPVDLRVLKALTAALEEITPGNGYVHDLTGSVYRGRLVFSDQDGLPAVAINEPPKSPEQIESPQSGTAMASRHELLIQGFVDDDRQNPTDPAYRLMADVKMRLAQERGRDDGFNILGMGTRVSGLHIGKGVVRPPDAAVSDVAFFWLPVTLEYAEDLQNPFA